MDTLSTDLAELTALLAACNPALDKRIRELEARIKRGSTHKKSPHNVASVGNPSNINVLDVC